MGFALPQPWFWFCCCDLGAWFGQGRGGEAAPSPCWGLWLSPCFGNHPRAAWSSNLQAHRAQAELLAGPCCAPGWQGDISCRILLLPMGISLAVCRRSLASLQVQEGATLVNEAALERNMGVPASKSLVGPVPY